MDRLTNHSVVVLSIGSVNIDEAFEKKVSEYLRINHRQLPENVPHEMAKGPFFQTMKTAFGTDATVRNIKIPIPPSNERFELSL